MTEFPAQLRQVAEQAKRKKHAYVPILQAADLLEDLTARLSTMQSQLAFRNSHPFHPAQDLAQARQYARFFPCPAPSCRANQFEPCNTISMTDHDERVTWWLSNGRPLKAG